MVDRRPFSEFVKNVKTIEAGYLVTAGLDEGADRRGSPRPWSPRD